MRNEILEQYLPLTPEEKEELKNKKIKKHHVATVFLHWFNLFVWITELITGAALIVSINYRFIPKFLTDIVDGVYGTRANIIKTHIFVGVIWAFVLILYALFGWRRYLKPTLKQIFFITKDDIDWLKTKFEEVALNKKVHYPPQDSYNGGQKLFAQVVAIMVPVIIVTGFIMAFHLLPPALIRWAIIIHFGAVGLVVMGLSVHIYMALLYPPEQEGFFGMITGYISEYFAYHHHYKFWRKKKKGLDAPPELEPKKDWGPIFAGIFLGVVLFFSYYLTGFGLGASGFFQRTLIAVLGAFAPEAVKAHPYMGHYWGVYPLWNFLVFMGFGLVGGTLAAMFFAHHKFRFRIERGKNITDIQRLVLSVIGGIIVGFATRIAGGCTSSQALSGGAVFSPSGWIFMLALFAGGYLAAFIFRRFWK